MRCFRSFSLVYCEECGNRSEAMRREAEIKRMTRAEKERLVLSFRLGGSGSGGDSRLRERGGKNDG